MPGKPEYLVLPGANSDIQSDEPKEHWVPLSSLPQGHIQALNGYLHRIYICLYSTDHIYWIIFIVKLYYYCPVDGHFRIYSLPYFFSPLNIIDAEGVLYQK